jgi:mobilome CxxCx(11)CxxC protein
MTSKIDQTKLNAIFAIILHRKRMWKFEILNTIIIALTVIVPVTFINAQYVSKGSSYEPTANLLCFMLSIALIGIAVLSLIFKFTDRISTHKMGIRNNIYISNECDNASNAKLTEKELAWFYRYVTEIDSQDRVTFEKVWDSIRKDTYREALKAYAPGNFKIKCSKCHSSPWDYKKGDCPQCGNTFSAA